MARYDSARPEGYPCWIDLSSPDPDAAARFYSTVLGWTYELTGQEYGGYRLAQAAGRHVAGIGGMHEGGDGPSAWTIYFAADEVDDMTRRAESLGGRVLAAPFDVGDEGRMAIIQDPTGAVFGIWQTLQHFGAGVDEVHGSSAWREVNTRDSAAAGDFYGSLLGAEVKAMEGAPFVYMTLEKGEDTIGGILQMTEEWEGIPPHWMNYFQVDDLDMAVSAVETEGGKVLVPPFDSSYGRIAVVADPFGASFSLIRLADAG